MSIPDRKGDRDENVGFDGKENVGDTGACRGDPGRGVWLRRLLGRRKTEGPAAGGDRRMRGHERGGRGPVPNAPRGYRVRHLPGNPGRGGRRAGWGAPRAGPGGGG